MNEEWKTIEHALSYLQKADSIPHRVEGESVLLEEISSQSRRILDLGSGDGRLLKLILLKCPDAYGIALDFSPIMLSKLRERYSNDDRVEIIEHDLNSPLPLNLGEFDVIASSFAIHHLPNDRKFKLYTEIFKALESDGIFCNLEHVSSPNQNLHKKFYEYIGGEEDKSNILLDVETQLNWLREIGFNDVDCYWKWRELALLIGIKR